jgi:hypothetical protein
MERCALDSGGAVLRDGPRIKPMRTTLDIDDDLLVITRQLARQRGVSLGKVISDLASASLKMRNGALLFTPKTSTPKHDLRTVNELRDDS